MLAENVYWFYGTKATYIYVAQKHISGKEQHFDSYGVVFQFSRHYVSVVHFNI